MCVEQLGPVQRGRARVVLRLFAWSHKHADMTGNDDVFDCSCVACFWCFWHCTTTAGNYLGDDGDADVMALLAPALQSMPLMTSLNLSGACTNQGRRGQWQWQSVVAVWAWAWDVVACGDRQRWWV